LPHENNRIIEVHIIPFQNQNGEWLVAEFNIDITEHKRIEQALKDSETRYRAVMEQATEGILLFDVETRRIVETNFTYQSMLGYSAEDLLQLTAYDVIYHNRESIDYYIEKIKKQYRLIVGNRQHRHKSGHPIDVEVSAYMIEIQSHQTMCVVVRDITERIQSERTMQSLLQRQSLILQSLSAVFYTASAEGDMTTLWISDQIETITGYASSDFTSDPFFWTRHLHPNERDEMVMRYQSILIERELTLEYRWLCADGTYRWFQDQMMLIQDEQDRPKEIIGFWLDITERKRAEEEKQSMEAQLQHTQKLESLGILAGGIAHDFNNLLTSVLGYADLSVKKISSDSPIRDYLLEIEQAALRASDLCRQMLAYSGRGKFIVQPTDLPIIVKEMTSIIKVSLSKKIILQYQFDPETPFIDADQAQIRQIILNLVINASEAIGDNDGVITIKTGSQFCDSVFFETTWLHDPLPDGNYVSLEVNDTGCGMDMQTLSKIFDPFFTTKFSGRGLGLAAVLGIVRGHKGALHVFSDPGKGTTFKIVFPAGKHSTEKSKPVATEPLFSGQGMILLVDDEEPIRKLGKEVLEMNGFQVETAKDGVDAVNLFRNNPDKYQCIILDLTMPRMDGKQAFHELIKIRPDVQVILSSGYSEYEIAKQFVHDRIAGFIQKPYDIELLCQLLKKVINPTLS
jgi:PAS domain S-box-containing protein